MFKNLLMVCLIFVLSASTMFGDILGQNIDHEITEEEALIMMNNFNQNPGGLTGTTSFVLDKTAIQQILNLNNCQGIHYYLGKENDGSNVVVFFGVDDQSKNIGNPYKCDGLFNGVIMSISDVQPLIDNFITAHPNEMRSGFYCRAIFDTMLSQAGSNGIKFDFARYDDGELTYVYYSVFNSLLKTADDDSVVYGNASFGGG